MPKKKKSCSGFKFLTGHKRSRIDTKVFFDTLVFRNENDSMFNKKSWEIVGKIAVAMIILNTITVILGYLFMVFLKKDERPLIAYLNEWFLSTAFSVSHVVIALVSGLIFIWLNRTHKKLIRTQISDAKLNKVIIISKFVPDFKYAVQRRLREQGYLSEMDFILLQTERLYSELRDIASSAEAT